MDIYILDNGDFTKTLEACNPLSGIAVNIKNFSKCQQNLPFSQRRPTASNLLNLAPNHFSLLSRYFHSSGLTASRVLVLAEHNNSTLAPTTLHAVTAATLLNPTEGIDLLVAGSKCKEVAKCAQNISAITCVLVRDSHLYQHHLAEPMAALIQGYHKKIAYSHIIASSSTFGKNILPRLAGLLDVQPITDIISIESDDTFVRPIYAGNILSTVQSSDPVKVMTIRPISFQPSALSTQSPANKIQIINEDYGAESINSAKWISAETPTSERPDLGSAKVIISGGRALDSAENFQLLYQLADKFGKTATVGASRAAVDAGYVANDLQIGQTGKVVAPDLYIAVGISGAIQHLAGMINSKAIVAINKDEEAPIFKVADYALVGDLFTIIPELISSLPSPAK